MMDNYPCRVKGCMLKKRNGRCKAFEDNARLPEKAGTTDCWAYMKKLPTTEEIAQAFHVG